MSFRRLALYASLGLALVGCGTLAQLGGLEVCVAAGRSASVPSASPTAAPTVIVVALPSSTAMASTAPTTAPTVAP